MKSRILSLILTAAIVITMIPSVPVMAMPAQGGTVYSVETAISDEEDSADDFGDETSDEEENTEQKTDETEKTTESPEGETPDETPTETPDEEPTETPEAVTPSEEPTETPDDETSTEAPTQVPGDDTLAASPTKTPDIEKPTETPEKVISTSEPTATPTATAEVKENKEGMIGKEDVTAKAVGTNGIMYEGVAYLSVKAVNNLPEDTQDVYREMCDTVAEWKENHEDVKDIVISVNKNKELELSVSIPLLELYTADVQEQFLDGEADKTSEAADESSESETKDEEADEDTLDADEDTNNEADSEDNKSKEEQKDDTSDVSDADDISDTDDISDADDTDEEEEAKEEELENSAAEEEVLLEDSDKKETEELVPENLSLAASYDIQEETIDSEPFVELDTLILNEDYFKSQLTSFEQGLYNAGKASMVKKGSNSFSYKASSWAGSLTPFCNAVSALVNTYPNSFNWMNIGTGSIRASYRYSKGKYTYSVKIDKSKHYSKSLETSANKKVSQLVEAANKYAAEKYPGCPTYGMIEYFNKWICENNYYNYTGTASDSRTRGGSTYYYCHNCYGILLKGYGVCESYAMAMTRLLDAAGIRNLYAVGDAGGGHAWNYVQMPDGKWYLLDATWNDDDRNNKVTKDYFLVKDDGVHKPNGKRYVSGMTFSFYSRATANYTYSATAESAKLSAIKINQSSVALKPKAKYQLSVSTDAYYDKFVKTWSSSNTKVAKVDKNGKITAGTTPGKATISMKVAGTTKTCTVYVYQFTGLSFSNNNKSSYKQTYENADTVFDSKDVISLNINVKQKNEATTSANIRSYAGLAAPTATSNKTSVAAVSGVTLSGNTINLKVQPKAVGTAKITVKFAGKSATYTITVKQKLQEGWFANLPYSSVGYTGKAYKPAVAKTAAAPKTVKYTVSYSNNTNAGTATVKLKGTGNYCGEIVKNFIIKPQSITTANFSSCTAKANYNGKAQKATTRVKLGSKTLKAGKDYDIKYNNSLTAPTAVGKYTVQIVGKGNYTGTVSTTKTFEIFPVTLDKVTVSCSTTVKYKGSNVYPSIKVKIGSSVLTTADYKVTYYNASGSVVSAPNAKGNYKAVITPVGKNVTVSAKKTSITKSFKVK